MVTTMTMKFKRHFGESRTVSEKRNKKKKNSTNSVSDVTLIDDGDILARENEKKKRKKMSRPKQQKAHRSIIQMTKELIKD